MRHLLSIIFIIALSTVSMAAEVKSSIELEFNYFDSDRDYYNSRAKYSAAYNYHKIDIFYDRVDKLNRRYDPLHDVGILYSYMDDKQLGGVMLSSASDKPFSGLETLSAGAFYGYKVYSNILGTEEIALADGTIYNLERKIGLYLGAGLMNEDLIFSGSYLLPVVSFMYEGKYLRVYLGIPVTAIIINYQQHMLTFTGIMGLTDSYAVEYTFSLDEVNRFSLSFEEELVKYRIKEYVEQGKYDDWRLHYNYRWLKAKYARKLNSQVELAVWAAYMYKGYTNLDDEFHRDEKLDNTKQYGISLKADF